MRQTMTKFKTTVTENYKYILSIIFTILFGIILYTNATHYPIKFLGLIFLISTLLIVFLPSKIEIASVLIILTFGSLSAILSPINDIPDEYVHYARSVFVSEGHLNLSNQKSHLQVSKDVKTITNHTGAQYTERELLRKKHNTSEYPEINIKGTNAYYSLSYFPQAIGICIGNILGFPLLITYYLGRLTNLLCYSILVFVIIKLSGKYKQIFSVVTMMPMNIYLAGSYNQDAFAIGITLLTISLFINLLTSKNSSKNNIKLLFFLVLSNTLVLTKFTYFLLVFLILFIPLDRFGNWRKLTLINKLIGVLIVTLFAAFWFKLYGQIKTPYVADFLKQIDVGAQIHNILKSPDLYGRVVIREMLVNLINMDNIFQFGPLTYGITNIFPLYLIFLFFIFLSNASKIKVTFIEKFGIFCVISGIIGATVLAMYLTWTPAGNLTVLGVQSRYLIGVIPLLFLLFSTDHTKIKQMDNFVSNKLSAHFSMLFILLMLVATVFKYY